MKAYVIDWLDHYVDPSSTAWTPVNSLSPAPVEVRSVGYVVKRDKKIVTIAHTLHEGEAIGLFHILRSDIVSMQRVALPPIKKKALKRRKPSEHRIVHEEVAARG